MLLMAQVITKTQKQLLHKAVDTGNAQLIARCVVNVSEIYEELRKIHDQKGKDDVQPSQNGSEGGNTKQSFL